MQSRKLRAFLVLALGLAACSAKEADPDAAHGTGSAIRELRSPVARATPTSGAEQATLLDLNAFAWSFYGQVKTRAANFVYSPYSIVAASAMLSAGAAGETLSQIGSALRFKQTGDALHAGQNALALLLESRNREATESLGAQSLRISNDLWLSPEFEPTPAFLDSLSREYDTGVHLAPFATDPEESRVAINRKVSDDTRALIPELLPGGSIDSSVVFVLTNALYFKANWAGKFEKTATQPRPFTTLAGASVEVPTMRGTLVAKYFEGNGFFAVGLPYAGRDFEMVFIVPNAGTFSSFVDSLKDDGVAQILGGLTGGALLVSLPKFEVKTDLSLRTELERAGMVNAFLPGIADFPAIGDVYISRAFHQAHLTLDEDGTEAAAATAFGGTPPSVPPSATIDRPFVFFLRDKSGAILFVGHVVDPRL